MRNELSDLASFAAIAEERSFTRAARRLGVSQSALSHSMSGLEKRLGLELLARTSRSVSPTAAGERLLKDLGPALEQIQQSLNDVRKQTTRPAGRIRLLVPRVAVSMVLLPKLAALQRSIRRLCWISPLQAIGLISSLPATTREYRSGNSFSAT